MAKVNTQVMRVVRWRGGNHPTLDLMKQTLEQHGLRPFKWSHHANYRYGVRSHGYAKTIYCVEGGVECFFPDTRQRVQLRAGDRVDIARGVRHGITVGLNGATCLEGTPIGRSALAISGR